MNNEDNVVRMKYTLYILLAVSVFAGGCFAGFALTPDPKVSAAEADKQYVLPPHTKFNILLLGIDERRNDKGRSNVTCLMTIDSDARSATLLWVPRDSRVDIPGYEWNKIGHAYSYGGPELARKTVSELLGVPIQYYLAVNMAGFPKIIDAAGGVDLLVDKRMYYYDPYDEGEVNNDGLIDLKAGAQHLNGNQASQYVRFRHDEKGDIGRIERQQRFIHAFVSQLVKPQVLTQLPLMLQVVKENVQTDIPANLLLAFSGMVGDAARNGVATEMVDGRPVYIRNISYWLPNIEKMRAQVARIQGVAVDERYQTYSRKLLTEQQASLTGLPVSDAP